MISVEIAKALGLLAFLAVGGLCSVRSPIRPSILIVGGMAMIVLIGLVGNTSGKPLHHLTERSFLASTIALCACMVLARTIINVRTKKYD